MAIDNTMPRTTAQITICVKRLLRMVAGVP